MEFRFSSQKSLYLFSAITALLLFFDLASYFYLFGEGELFLEWYDKYFNLEYERNVPTFFSFLLSFLTGLTAWMVYREKKRFGWLVTALFFLYFAFDDALSLHEYVGSFLGETFFRHATDSYYWQITFMPMFAVVGLFVFLFLSKEFHTASCRNCIVKLIVGFGCYALAVGLDYYEGLDPDFSYIMKRTEYFSYDDLIHVLRVTEEAIEMFGATLILSALLWIRPLRITVS